MARRKSKKIGKVRSRRTRRVGDVKGTVISSAGLIVGAIAGNYLKDKLAETLTIKATDPKKTDMNLSGVAVLAIGMFGPKFVKSPMLKSVFDGMIVSGGVSTVSTFFPTLPMNGIDEIGRVDTIGAYVVQGIPTIGETIVNESYDEFAY